MKIDVTKPITDLRGEPVFEQAADGTKTLLLTKDVIVTALLTPTNPLPSATESVRIYKLATGVHGATGPHEIKIEDLALIKERVAAVFPPLTVGRLFDILEGESAHG